MSNQQSAGDDIPYSGITCAKCESPLDRYGPCPRCGSHWAYRVVRNTGLHVPVNAAQLSPLGNCDSEHRGNC